MELIRGALAETPAAGERIKIPVERLTLAKRRWRGAGEDGREFGFDLEQPLQDGDSVFASESASYFIAQKYEPVLEVGAGAQSARLGWMIGNLHFQIEISGDLVRVVDDPAVRQLFARENIEFTACKRVFHPLTGGHQH